MENTENILNDTDFVYFEAMLSVIGVVVKKPKLVVVDELENIVYLFLQGELTATPWSMDKTHFYSGEKPYWAVAEKCHRHGNHTFCRVD